MTKISDVIIIHSRDKASTAKSLGALYALALAQLPLGINETWVPINEAIQNRFGGNGTCGGFQGLERVKKAGWKLYEDVAKIDHHRKVASQ